MRPHLAEMRESVASVLSRSFFVTRQMDREFRHPYRRFTTADSSPAGAHASYGFSGFRYVRLDDQGQIIDRDAAYKAPGRFREQRLRA